MSQSLCHMLTHIIFSTRHRKPLITPDTQSDLFAYMGGVLKKIKCIPVAIGGMNDHVHVLAYQHQTITIAGLIEEIKTTTSGWMKSTKLIRNFYWQKGYAAFSVSESLVPKVVNYIQNQSEHHQRTDFKSELIAFLKKHRVKYDEQYLWD